MSIYQMNDKAAVGFRFGALSPPLHIQAEEQGFYLEDDDVHQANADAITRLYMSGLLPELDASKARQRLMDRIMGDLYRESVEQNTEDG